MNNSQKKNFQVNFGELFSFLIGVRLRRPLNHRKQTRFVSVKLFDINAAAVERRLIYVGLLYFLGVTS